MKEVDDDGETVELLLGRSGVGRESDVGRGYAFGIVQRHGRAAFGYQCLLNLGADGLDIGLSFAHDCEGR